jgi:cyclic pyranopterin phosphate synthase
LKPRSFAKDNGLVQVLDTFQRPLKDLRVSVTDRCNYRCNYCMPFDEYAWSPREELLTFEEIVRVVALFLDLGVEKIRLTGGEPLVRSDLEDLVRSLAALTSLDDISLTTNGSLLAQKAAGLRSAGLRRINVSLDTLRPDRFRDLTRRGDLPQVFEGIAAARAAGLSPIKINTVVMKGVNDDEILDIVEYCRGHALELRFIEFMDVGNSNNWRMERTVTKREILDAVSARYPLEEIGRPDGRAPAEEFRFLDGGGTLGIIGSVTEPFCSSCTRARMTADGRFVTCLFSESGFDLRALLRTGATDDEIRQAIVDVWNGRADRYSDLRWESIRSGKPVSAARKIEMITLGG